MDSTQATHDQDNTAPEVSESERVRSWLQALDDEYENEDVPEVQMNQNSDDDWETISSNIREPQQYITTHYIDGTWTLTVDGTSEEWHWQSEPDYSITRHASQDDRTHVPRRSLFHTQPYTMPHYDPWPLMPDSTEEELNEHPEPYCITYNRTSAHPPDQNNATVTTSDARTPQPYSNTHQRGAEDIDPIDSRAEEARVLRQDIDNAKEMAQHMVAQLEPTDPSEGNAIEAINLLLGVIERLEAVQLGDTDAEA